MCISRRIKHSRKITSIGITSSKTKLTNTSSTKVRSEKVSHRFTSFTRNGNMPVNQGLEEPSKEMFFLKKNLIRGI